MSKAMDNGESHEEKEGKKERSRPFQANNSVQIRMDNREDSMSTRT